jgi:hypothetical protein
MMLTKLAAFAVAVSVPTTASLAQVTLRTDPSGGYGQVALAKNDDSSSQQLTLPFQINFYGELFNTFFVNNNGNITFDAPLGTFTPFQFGNLTQAMIAPYWADVDTRCAACGNVYVGSFAAGQVSVTWDNVGYFPSNATKLNNFQLTLFEATGPGTSAGDFDIEFRYNQLQWTTGGASQGIDGLGGIPAAAGYTNGAGIANLQPGSFLSPGALNMTNESNTGQDGLWVYNIRNAQTPAGYGLSPSNPILPTGQVPGDGYSFTFNVGDTSTRIFIDPPVATGYDYAVSGNTFTSASFGDNLTGLDSYELYNGATLLGTVLRGQVFNFATPLSSFSLRGIDPANLLVPGDPLAFVSGFTFGQTGQTIVTQVPFVEDISVAAAVPEPTSWAMMILGFGAIGGSLRRRRPTTTVAFA